MNLRVSGRVNHYSAPRLEEATYTQYAYGDAKGPTEQAARFLAGFARLRPFDAANEGTALLAVLTFLERNGLSLDLTADEIGPWSRDAARTIEDARRGIAACALPTSADHAGSAGATTVREVAGELLARYGDAAFAAPAANAAPAQRDAITA